MIESGDVPMDPGEANMKVQETLCRVRHLCAFGPLVTDIARI